MALLWLDGFESYGDIGAVTPADALKRRYEVDGGANITVVEGRNGSGKALNIPYGVLKTWYFRTPPLTTDDTICVSFAFKKTGSMNLSHRLVSLYSGTALSINIGYTAGGSLAVYRASTQIGYTIGLVISQNVWYYVQLKVKCHDSTGTFELKIGDTTVANASGIDTKATTLAYHDRVLFGVINGTSYGIQIDDFSVADSTGSENNDFLGNTKVVMINPDGDDTANWTTAQPSGNHYSTLNESEADDATYVQETTVNVTDLYDYAAIPTLGNITGIQINTDCTETDATSYSLITPVESNSSQYDDSAQPIGTTGYKTIRRVVETDPDTATYWDEAGLNAAKFGVKVG